MAFTLNLLKTTKSLFPLAIRLTRVQSNYHSSISTALNSCLPSKQPYRLYPNSFYSVTAGVKEIERIIDDVNRKCGVILKKIEKMENIMEKMESKAMVEKGPPPSELMKTQHYTAIPKLVSSFELALLDMKDMKLRTMEIMFKNMEIKVKKVEIESEFFLLVERDDEYY